MSDLPLNKKLYAVRQMNTQIRLLMLIALIIFPGLAAADTTRSCTTQYSVSVKSIDGADGITYPAFSGQGTTTIFAPNTARSRARENLDECTWCWYRQDDEAVYCSEANQIYSYPFTDGALAQITDDICKSLPRT